MAGGRLLLRCAVQERHGSCCFPHSLSHLCDANLFALSLAVGFIREDTS